MAKTKGDALALFLRLIDEATKKGVNLPTTKNADYRDKFNHFLNEAQIYIAGLVKIPAVYTITQNPIPNQLGLLKQHDIQQYLPGNNKVFTQVGTKAYYFEVDNIGTITIAVNGVTVKTIENTVKRVFTAHKYNTGATSTDTVTITFTGEYPYNIKNVALYAYKFPADDDVPVYAPYVEYAMPADFMSFDIVTLKSDPRVYELYKAYKWENNKKVILEYYKSGSFDIHYYKYPTAILPTAADSTELEIEDKAFDLLVLHTGILATAADNANLSAYLRSLFIEKAQNVVGMEVPQESAVQTIYSMN
jgi:hypothetical protein